MIPSVGRRRVRQPEVLLVASMQHAVELLEVVHHRQGAADPGQHLEPLLEVIDLGQPISDRKTGESVGSSLPGLEN